MNTHLTQILFYADHPIVVGMVLQCVIFLLAFGIVRLIPQSTVAIAIEWFFEKMYEFFEEILGKDEQEWIKHYILALFFIIFTANSISVLLDFVAPIF